MNDKKPSSMSKAFSMFDPWSFASAVSEYGVDAWQRSILFADVRRQRGDQYREHLQEQVPNVLNFDCELVMSGLEFTRPINYGMVRILPTADVTIDPVKRPFIVIDPRAGHGPGIGGFKPDSEIGAAMKAGHACYFVGFLPDPVPGQTVEDVMRGLAHFVRHVGELHDSCIGKPAVIGNCQAGWLVMMAASLWPELFGPLIVAGAPLSYWAGDNPMRYGGGLTGGSWLTALTSDLGAGRFDGAWLVENFEKLDPANTWWAKNYHLYANVDTEGPRYLEFEKYWGGYVFLNDIEMQYIVDNLFIGNRLSSAELITSDGLRIDLRNIRSPIVVFCSYGDNITPPPQALGWITDLYRNDEDVASHDQTIVYTTHESIGHLGIFVSGKVGRKEHVEFTSNIDLIDLLPAGVYQATVDDNPDAAQSPHGPGSHDGYFMALHRRTLDDVRNIVKPDPASDHRFRAAARVSDTNLALYKRFVQPWVQGMVTPEIASMMQTLHPLRMSYEWWSSTNTLAPTVAGAATRLRDDRREIMPDNPFWQVQENVSAMIVRLLDSYRDQRDQMYAWLFEGLYGSPLVQALTGYPAESDLPARNHPGDSPEHLAFVERELARIRDRMTEGGLLEATVRAIFYILRTRGEADERHFRHALKFHGPERSGDFDMSSFRALVRDQAVLLAHDAKAAMEAIPTLLQRANADDIRERAQDLERLVKSSGTLLAEEEASLQRILALFEQSAPAKKLDVAKSSISAPTAPEPKLASISTHRTPLPHSTQPQKSALPTATSATEKIPAVPAKKASSVTRQLPTSATKNSSAMKDDVIAAAKPSSSLKDDAAELASSTTKAAAPVTDTPAAVKTPPAPITKAPVPAKKAAAPVTKTPAPAKKAAAPVTKTPAPAKKAAAPVTKPPAPAKKAAASVTKTPAPAKKAAASVTKTPAPAKKAAAPTATTGKATTSAKQLAALPAKALPSAKKATSAKTAHTRQPAAQKVSRTSAAKTAPKKGSEK
ncbi:DUF3141 domain-containing protein [Alcaligenaceae bacterium]|nr:DUF3141 domain-containing protein [Alcaligenaceae bacterium]